MSEIYWERTNRKSRGWIDLIVKDDAERIVIDSALLDQPTRLLTEVDISTALASQGVIAADPGRILADLQARKVRKERPVKALYVAFYCNAEDDTGMDEVNQEFLTATSQDAAEKLFYRKQGKETAEFLYVSIWPVRALMGQLAAELERTKL